MKRFFGIFAYLHGFLKALFNIHPNKTFIKADEFEGVESTQSIVVTNVNEFFKRQLSPQQSALADGFLNVSIFRSPTLTDILSVIWKLFRGDYSPDWRYHTFKTKKIYVLPFHKYPHMQIDGELTQLPYFDIEVVPRALSVVTNKEL